VTRPEKVQLIGEGTKMDYAGLLMVISVSSYGAWNSL